MLNVKPFTWIFETDYNFHFYNIILPIYQIDISNHSKRKSFNKKYATLKSKEINMNSSSFLRLYCTFFYKPMIKKI